MPDLTPDELLREWSEPGDEYGPDYDDHVAPEDVLQHMTVLLARQLLDAREALRGVMAAHEEMRRRHVDTCGTFAPGMRYHRSVDKCEVCNSLFGMESLPMLMGVASPRSCLPEHQEPDDA